LRSPGHDIAGNALAVGDQEQESANALPSVGVIMIKLEADLVEDDVACPNRDRACECIGRNAQALQFLHLTRPQVVGGVEDTHGANGGHGVTLHWLSPSRTIPASSATSMA
jgi:hypothetical protein